MSKRANPVKSGYWWTESNLPIEGINTDLFTHVYFAFADLDPKTQQVTIPESKLDLISNFSRLIKGNNPNVKTLLSIGSRDGEDRNAFTEMVRDSDNRRTFIESSIAVSRKYKFDGIDLHWLYPSTRLQMFNLGHLLNEWHSILWEEELLVATVYYLPTISENVDYPILEMKKCLDWINVQSYDFYTPQSIPPQTGPAHAYLNPIHENNSNFYGQFGLDNGWFKKAKFPGEKLVLGLPFYGWAWKLPSDSPKTDIFSPTLGPVKEVSPDGDGRIDYGHIKDFIPNFSESSIFLKDYISSYTFLNDIWVSYDDKSCIIAKIAQAKDDLRYLLRGYYAWHIGGDDQTYTLATAAHDAWN